MWNKIFFFFGGGGGGGGGGFFIETCYRILHNSLCRGTITRYLQIIWDFEDSSKIIFLISGHKHVMLH